MTSNFPARSQRVEINSQKPKAMTCELSFLRRLVVGALPDTPVLPRPNSEKGGEMEEKKEEKWKEKKEEKCKKKKRISLKNRRKKRFRIFI